MLQKNSKTTAKWKYLLLVPVLAGMLTYVGCSTDKSSDDNQPQTLEQQIIDLQATIDAKGELTENEKKGIVDLATHSLNKAISSEANISINMDDSTNDNEVADVPFAVIEEVPIYPGCEDLVDNKAKKSCMSEKLTDFVSKNFDTSLGEKLGLTGLSKIYVLFKIEKNGHVQFMKSRGPDPALEKEAERIVNLLPHMKPGKQNGQPVNVLYALPMVFETAQ